MGTNKSLLALKVLLNILLTNSHKWLGLLIASTRPWNLYRITSLSISSGLHRGQGTMTWKTGEIYTGQWDNDVREGIGVLIFSKESPTDRFENSTSGCVLVWWEPCRWYSIPTSTNHSGLSLSRDFISLSDRSIPEYSRYSIRLALAVAWVVAHSKVVLWVLSSNVAIFVIN